MYRIIGILAAVAAVVVIGAVAFAYLTLTGALSGVSAELQIGDAMPDFEMEATDGETYRLSEYEGEIVVLDFCSHLCPWSEGVDVHMPAVYEEYSEQGVVFLGIDSHYDVDLDEIRDYVEEAGKPYPVLKDENHAYADLVGARITPEIFVINEEGYLVYQGAFDNRIRPTTEGAANYLRNTLDALLAGDPVPRERVSAWGCTIKRGD